ncbi:TPA: hypothetical protein I7761_01165 [Vibrio vulnificus]|nr:hypothetical protein [Vibrio vulnificus]HAS8462003.1 hypothetical protein [Vibrio vulnificus]HDY7971075.1 hypothetical protein [Vibrio vulnificus]
MKFRNSQQVNFFASVSKASIEDSKDKLATKCKFNFAYFDSSTQDFSAWDYNQLIKLLNKIKDFSRESLKHWSEVPSKSGEIFKVYLKYPGHSKFTKPASIPHQAQWRAFRIEAKVRLIGFVIPDSFNHQEQNCSGYRFCTNTFYVVFLDKDHEFYPTQKKDRKRKVRR